jgi:hypothetical protein
MLEFRSFTPDDSAEYCGAEQLPDGSLPLIADRTSWVDGHMVVVIAGNPDRHPVDQVVVEAFFYTEAGDSMESYMHHFPNVESAKVYIEALEDIKALHRVDFPRFRGWRRVQ